MTAATTDLDLPIIIRELDTDDVNFVLDSWKKSYRNYAFSVPRRDSGRWDGQSPLPTGLYSQEHEQVARNLLERAKTLVATRAEDPEQILGWVCYEPGLLHYVYVKKIYRDWGIGRRLLERAGVTRDNPAVFSHRTAASDQKLTQRMKRFNPYRAWR